MKYERLLSYNKAKEWLIRLNQRNKKKQIIESMLDINLTAFFNCKQYYQLNMCNGDNIILKVIYMNKKEIVETFEFNTNFGKLKAYSNLSLRRPLTNEEDKEMKRLFDAVKSYMDKKEVNLK